jgi:TRAP-type C4-dicarboxylate transport system permease small subunit
MRDSVFLGRLDRVCRDVNVATEFLIGILVATTVCVTFVQVVCRYGLDASLSWSEELARYLFVWIIFLGSASAARRGQHMAVDLLAGILPRGLRKWSALLVLLITAGFFLTFGLLALQLTENAMQQTSSGLEIPVGWVYAAGPIGAALTLLHLSNGMIRTYAGLTATDPFEATALE